MGRINHYPADSMVYFVDTYPLDSNLSSEKCYPAFKQLGPESLSITKCLFLFLWTKTGEH